MAISKPFFYYTLMLFLSCASFVCKAHKTGPKTYIVHVTKPDHALLSNPDGLRAYHESFLPERTTSEGGRSSPIIYSYKHVISGFSAKLTPEEVESMKSLPGFVSAKEESISRPHTTHSPDFLGLHRDDGLWKGSSYGQGVIVGLLDTGILPNHPSFGDEGMPPPPQKWKGRCDLPANYRCNNKVIGARFFSFSADALDQEGHGTHTASTAAGNFVANVSVLGNAGGTAVGLAPRAHVAMYKVCTPDGCADGDILAGLDAAIEDGVDVVSLSLGRRSSGDLVGLTPLYDDNIAVGSFAAVQRGMFVSTSAGNDGPVAQTLSNEAPWLLTVGASTIDRSIRATAKLGDAREFDGESAFQPAGFPAEARFPLVYAGSDGRSVGRYCGAGSLAGVDVNGKIVVCDRGGNVGRLEKGKIAKISGAAGMILANDEPSGFTTIADAQPLPATLVSFKAGEEIKAYINSTKNPTATIVFKGTVIGDPTAPAVASFSSRGPSATSPGILKPDVIGPGVGVVAAWPLSLADNSMPDVTFNFLSGTSMSCPHLSGIAALLKSLHPDWSPAAVKSAIMTTADAVNLKGQPIADQTLNQADPYASGAGHVNPARASDPGLVYDIASDDYIPYLCGLDGYTEENVGTIVHKKVSCAKKITEGELNYPTFSVELESNASKSYGRTVTNVGPTSSSYTVRVVAPKGVGVSVAPQTLAFKALNEKLSYNVTFTRDEKVTKGFTYGALEWVSGKYVVRSVIVATFT